MFNAHLFGEDDPVAMFHAAGLRRQAGGAQRRFDEFYRCYPVAMLPGPDRENLNYGGKVVMPPSALDRLTRLHITYPMMFELINKSKEVTTHAGVLEFIAEEGKIYLPYWMMQTLLLESGDLLHILSTDLPNGSSIKLQPQSVSFLEISDPRAVLENVLRNFSAMTKGDIFSFGYNEQIYDVAVLETKPENKTNAISVVETDLIVDFAPPIGYVEPTRSAAGDKSQGKENPGVPSGGVLHSQGGMAQAINYSSIAPSSQAAAAGAKAVSSNFLLGGQKLSSKKGSKAPTPKPSTPVAGTSTNPIPARPLRVTNGPQPLRLAPGKLFFGYEVKELKKKDASGSAAEQEGKQTFKGLGQSLRGGIKRKNDVPENKSNENVNNKKDTNAGGGRTLGKKAPGE
ncbi:MAG: ubiquitin fusion degradation protein [Trizodia sp. TS-e1964]|nr:MAG: ubiquitin fusion degradation protein [Trizodia sp. TS-e1964]